MSQVIISRFRAARRDPQLALLEGFHALKHALRFGATPHLIVASDTADLHGLARELAPDIVDRLTDVITVAPETYRQLAPIAHATGIMALADRRAYRATDILLSDRPEPVIFLDSPQRSNNIGAVIRVAAAAGSAGVLTSGDKDPWSPDAIRSAAGLQFALPVARVETLPDTHRPVIAIDPEGERAPGQLPPGAVLMFGTERGGLSGELIKRASTSWRLPMQPGVSSLNLATSVAAVLYGAKPSSFDALQ